MAFSLGGWIDYFRARFPGKQKKDEYFVTICPYCGNSRSNFQINTVDAVFHCWACGVGGSVQTLSKDFDLGIEGLPSSVRAVSLDEEGVVDLPADRKPILGSDDLFARQALAYLTGVRGLRVDEIEKYEITYGISGVYFGRVILPLFEEGELCFFAARSFLNNVKPKYKFPPRLKRNLFPLFQGNSTLVIVENAFSSLRAHRAGYSSWPLLGKFFTPVQVRKIREKRFERIVVVLDEDSVLGSIDRCEVLRREGLPAFFANTGGADPDELSVEDFRKLVEGARLPTLREKLELRMG